MPATSLVKAFNDHSATIGVAGLGYVGLPLAVEYAAAGFEVIGIEPNETRTAQLNAGTNYIDDLDDAHVASLVEQGRLRASTDYSAAGDVDVFFLCVPTPVTEHKEPDTKYIEAATRSIAKHLRPGQLIILKSTTYPDTTEGVVQPILEEAAAEKGLALGEDYFLAFSPERIDPGNKEFTTANTPVVVGGVTDACTEVAEAALRAIIAQVHVAPSPKVAEMEKLLENIFRSVNIALVNELAKLCDRIDDLSMWDVIDAAKTKPFGFMPFYPGPGLGGHCIPIDPYYLSWLARRYDFETSFITLAARVNEGMPYYVAEAVVEQIARQPVRLQDAKVLVLGVAFKGNVDDTRHSPAETIIRLLREKGIDKVAFADPHVESFAVHTANSDTRPVQKQSLTAETLQAYDVAVLVTDHEAFDTELIATHANAIVDTRNALSDITDERRSKICLLGGGHENGTLAEVEAVPSSTA
ncbi:UDP-N-acetyl-D-glucosamine dehydrogenase [Longimonas halophila]|uniref:UDP-N-acetyl-D-glucosamine dehydrogenase n=1 Tax=Longimonas halophila TaxID=1469170 RepID=A0A2H3NNW6_9BACT|nr:nucleotide sugar dehydrogenase [Longimonas halophila]PEN08530.1 UDP-N-acetyl-D-glucosamine dehydrogenase [Longimonas halophila]